MKKKILIVDDTPENIDFLVGILKDRYKLVAARDGSRALKLANSNNPPDLILLDIVMPGMNGMEVFHMLKRSEQTCNIPVIFITGVSEEEHSNAEIVGRVDFIRKPFHAQNILKRVEINLELSRYLTPV
ncbi:MAG: hypothetical protein CSA81_09515 [Acidobacteria bacterium]|nr:MAG: hypothetical protein CSA81_09515 [Acidobacteriota bacterium]